MGSGLYESDGWILLAVLLSSGGTRSVSLEEVIAAADYLNHAVPTLGELDGAFSRLQAAGWLALDGENIAATDTAEKMYSARRGDRKSLASHLSHVNARIGAKGWLEVPKKNDPETCSFAGLSRTKYERACREYLRKH